MRSENLRDLKYMIINYECLVEEAVAMQEVWNSDEASPEAQSACDPSDQFIKGQEIEAAYNEIILFINTKILKE